MTSREIAVSGQYIDGINGIDPVHAFWVNSYDGRGSVTLICYESAWTAYFGAMADRTIQEFFCDAGVDYLVTMMYSPTLKEGKPHEEYLAKIITAVKQSLMVAQS